MSREIKFRAWDREGKKMLLDVTPDPSGFSLFWGERGITGDHWEADPERHSELMQFTGLKDKNGKEIYEGDIFKAGKSKYLRVATFQSGCFLNTYLSGRNCWGGDHAGCLIWGHEQYEIIGNIHENPELLNDRT